MYFLISHDKNHVKNIVKDLCYRFRENDISLVYNTLNKSQIKWLHNNNIKVYDFKDYKKVESKIVIFLNINFLNNKCINHFKQKIIISISTDILTKFKLNKLSISDINIDIIKKNFKGLNKEYKPFLDYIERKIKISIIKNKNN